MNGIEIKKNSKKWDKGLVIVGNTALFMSIIVFVNTIVNNIDKLSAALKNPKDLFNGKYGIMLPVSLTAIVPVVCFFIVNMYFVAWWMEKRYVNKMSVEDLSKKLNNLSNINDNVGRLLNEYQDILSKFEQIKEKSASDLNELKSDFKNRCEELQKNMESILEHVGTQLSKGIEDYKNIQAEIDNKIKNLKEIRDIISVDMSNKGVVAHKLVEKVYTLYKNIKHEMEGKLRMKEEFLNTNVNDNKVTKLFKTATNRMAVKISENVGIGYETQEIKKGIENFFRNMEELLTEKLKQLKINLSADDFFKDILNDESVEDDIKSSCYICILKDVFLKSSNILLDWLSPLSNDEFGKKIDEISEGQLEELIGKAKRFTKGEESQKFILNVITEVIKLRRTTELFLKMNKTLKKNDINQQKRGNEAVDAIHSPLNVYGIESLQRRHSIS